MSETVLEEYGFKASMMAPGQMQAAERMAAECATLRARVAELEAQLATARAEERERWWDLVDRACNALTDSVMASGNDHKTNMHWIAKLHREAKSLRMEPPHE